MFYKFCLGALAVFALILGMFFNFLTLFLTFPLMIVLFPLDIICQLFRFKDNPFRRANRFLVNITFFVVRREYGNMF